MGPRPRGRGITEPETRPTIDTLPSMGPRPRGRGIGIPNLRRARPKRLQWGRDRAVAEFFPLDPHDTLIPSFNGAATARSRNWFTDFPYAGVQLVLQWGRDRAVAELT